eukprot:gnl/Dysnectes_brevis/6457_a10032_283.p1 GENE.gnl/Dysnectes_brevis/6457_a10032_283~~gnl/Dysnectes_brevis/6457_a10032_283.p1  ORF type:complete len:279 (-),score=34.43 gnl/Dysnectes_brevis/6457_a10032_283:83-919(-)
MMMLSGSFNDEQKREAFRLARQSRIVALRKIESQRAKSLASFYQQRAAKKTAEDTRKQKEIDEDQRCRQLQLATQEFERRTTTPSAKEVAEMVRTTAISQSRLEARKLAKAKAATLRRLKEASIADKILQEESERKQRDREIQKKRAQEREFHRAKQASSSSRAREARRKAFLAAKSSQSQVDIKANQAPVVTISAEPGMPCMPTRHRLDVLVESSPADSECAREAAGRVAAAHPEEVPAKPAPTPVAHPGPGSSVVHLADEALQILESMQKQLRHAS